MDADSKTLRQAEKYVDNLRLPLPRKPGAELDWPDNLADLGERELGSILTLLSGWLSYAVYHLAREETNLENFTQGYDIKMKQHIYRSGNDYATVTGVKAAVGQLPEMIDLQRKIQRAKAKVTVISSLVRGYESKYAAASREISRRKSEGGTHG